MATCHREPFQPDLITIAALSPQSTLVPDTYTEASQGRPVDFSDRQGQQAWAVVTAFANTVEEETVFRLFSSPDGVTFTPVPGVPDLPIVATNDYVDLMSFTVTEAFYNVSLVTDATANDMRVSACFVAFAG